MNRKTAILVLQFIVLLISQVYVFNRFELFGFVNPMVYILFILTMPFEYRKGTILIIAFLFGLFIDILSGIPGLHAAASVLLAFSRPLVIRQVSSIRDYEAGLKPSISDLGFIWFLKYAALLTFIHHTAFFLLERFTFMNFDVTLKHIVVTSVFSLVLIILFQYLLYTRRK